MLKKRKASEMTVGYGWYTQLTMKTELKYAKSGTYRKGNMQMFNMPQRRPYNILQTPNLHSKGLHREGYPLLRAQVSKEKSCEARSQATAHCTDVPVDLYTQEKPV